LVQKNKLTEILLKRWENNYVKKSMDEIGFDQFAVEDLRN